ncbi:MAG TPA: ATP-binding protein, partial [Anaeromyxobacteraceae bacterium]|nr:ATP-binding protein [Anaeromyxobacteraceae bacterium]
WVDGDPTRLAQVLGNLLQNAVKFTPARGRVTVGVRTIDHHAELRVRDDGLGIDPRDLERMFEPFMQADRDRTRGGLGLGLSLVKGLVELHGGTVLARSEGLGRGAELVVTLPASVAAPAPEREAAPAAAPAPAGAGRRVLVIEDNVDSAQTLADVLTLLGHHVVVARDATSGLRLASTERPDVVLCDLGLPDRDGYEVARALSADPGLRPPRLFALSGYAQPEDRQRAADAGFDAHVAKPPDMDELAALVASAPERH